MSSFFFQKLIFFETNLPNELSRVQKFLDTETGLKLKYRKVINVHIYILPAKQRVFPMTSWTLAASDEGD